MPGRAGRREGGTPQIVVTFNARYPPKHQKIKELLLGGEIGRVLSVDFTWYLDVFTAPTTSGAGTA